MLPKGNRVDAYRTIARTLASLEELVAIERVTDLDEMVLIFQCEAVTIPALVTRTIDVIVDAVNDVSGSIVGIDCDGALQTQNGFRAWGTIRIMEDDSPSRADLIVHGTVTESGISLSVRKPPPTESET